MVAQIVATFEDSSYTDDDPQKGLKIVELMQEVRSLCSSPMLQALTDATVYLSQMQEYGSPPAEIMGPLPPGFDLGADGLPKLPEGCTIA